MQPHPYLGAYYGMLCTYMYNERTGHSPHCTMECTVNGVFSLFAVYTEHSIQGITRNKMVALSPHRQPIRHVVKIFEGLLLLRRCS